MIATPKQVQLDTLAMRAIPDTLYRKQPELLADTLMSLARTATSTLKTLEDYLYEQGRHEEAAFVWRAVLIREVLDTEKPERMQLRSRGAYC